MDTQHNINPSRAERRQITYNGVTYDALDTIDGNRLLSANLPPISFTIDKILPQGLFILAGSPKVGKSWLALDMCVSVATGGTLWDYQATHGDVLYLSLEDSYNRLQTRLRHYANEGMDVANLNLSIKASTIQEGFIPQVDEFISRHKGTKLVVIDTLQHVRGNSNDKNAYFGDYRDMNYLRSITSKFPLSLILVHHTRKMDDADPLNTISGSTGLIGAVDGVFLLEKDSRTSDEGKLTIANRDTEGYEFKLLFNRDVCKWVLTENVSGNDNDDGRPLVLAIDEFLVNEWEGTATELCAALREVDDGLILTPATLTKQIKSVACLLTKNGTTVTFTRTRTQKTIRLSRNVTA